MRVRQNNLQACAYCPRPLRTSVFLCRRIWNLIRWRLRKQNHSLPTNSRSPNKHATFCAPNRSRKISMTVVRSLVSELPALDKTIQTTGIPTSRYAINDRQHQDIEVNSADFPVRPIQRQSVRPSNAEQPHDEQRELGRASRTLAESVGAVCSSIPLWPGQKMP